MLFESRKPEKIWLDRGSEFHNKTFKSLPREHTTYLYSTYTDLKAVFAERFNRTFLHIINKPRFINADGDWLSLINDAIVTYNNKHTKINITSVDASNSPDESGNRYSFSFKEIKPKLKFGDYVRNADNRNFFLTNV